MLVDIGQGGQSGGTGQRALLVSVVSQGSLGGDVESVPRDHCRQRKDPAAESLAQDEDVRDDSVVLASKHGACSAERAGDLIEDEQRSVQIAGAADGLPELRF